MTRLRLDSLVRRQKRPPSLDWAGQPPFEVATGEFVAFVGKSGAGKTALARLIAGLDSLDAGEIRIDDALVNGTPPPERGIALVFQDDGLWPHWNVAQNIAFGLKCRGVRRAARRLRVDEVLASVRLDGLAELRPQQLTHLQRWRVALARSLVLDPKVLIVDEPFGSIDEPEREELGREIRVVHEQYKLTS